MNYLLAIILVVLLVRWLVLRTTVQELRERLDQLEQRSVTSSELAVLTQRVYALEPHTPPIPDPEPVSTSFIAEEPAPIEAPPTPLPEDVTEPESYLATPSWRDRLRNIFGTDEWEALIGVSLLNKIGALLFVIGLAFALSYSFEHTTAAGRATIALTSSLAVLGAGVWVEGRQRYQVFARGLIGAGWAGFYATSYAVWAIPQARVIDNPFAGSFGMLAVTAGMTLHSLRYRSQAVTAVAFFTAFAALSVTPSSSFAVLSLIPLAIALLYLAARFEWHAMALFGLAATYATCISRGQSDAPLRLTQALFLCYWLLFEGFDWIRLKRHVVDRGLDLLFPLNTAAFLGLSYLAWSHHNPARLWLASAFAAALYLGDAMARALLRPPSTFQPDDPLLTRLRAGSYEGPSIVSAILAGLAVVGRVHGVWASIGIALDAEAVYLAGLWFASPFLRRCGARAFSLSLARLFWTSEFWSKTTVLGHATWNWSPPLLFHAALFYLNRALRQAGVIFSSAACAAIVIAIGAEAPHAFIGTAWLFFGALLFEFGQRKDSQEFRVQAYVVLAAGLLATTDFNFGARGNWVALTIALAIAYASAIRHRVLAIAGTAATALLGLLLLWAVVPARYVAASWFAFALLLLELGKRGLPEQMQFALGPVIAVSWLALLASGDLLKFPSTPVRLAWLAACAVCWTAAARVEASEILLQPILTGAGGIAAMGGLWLILPDPSVALAWVLLALGMLMFGAANSLAWLRWMSCGFALPGFLMALVHDIDPPQLLASTLAAVALYTAHFIARRAEEKQPALFYSVLGTLLTSAILYGEVSGGLLTVSWGLQGLFLLGAGFTLRERVLRLEGLVLLMGCILKLFLYDMRNLETLYRILSFVALGLILLCVSWIYSRFREHMKKLL